MQVCNDVDSKMKNKENELERQNDCFSLLLSC